MVGLGRTSNWAGASLSIARRVLRPCAVLTFGMVAAMASPGLAAPANHSNETSAYLSGPYCGVYCLHYALQHVACQVEIDDLIQPAYIGSPDGSSVGELIRAAEDQGARAVPFTGLTVDFLHQCPDPILLHVAGSARSIHYNHWVLFLGVADGQARIYDPPHDVTTIPLASLLSIWDGTGIMVSNDRNPMRGPGIAAYARVAGLMLACLGLVGVLRPWSLAQQGAAPSVSGLYRLRSLARQSCLLLVLAGVAGAAYDIADDAGIMRNPSAVAAVSNKFFPERIPEISRADLDKLVTDHRATIVDARSARQYEKGHITGAVNVPITEGLFGHRSQLERRPHSARIVVYCQNTQCAWAREVASRLIADGFEQTSVFPGGWEAWEDGQQ